MGENLEDTGGPTIDTVERYQGDERELMVVSATVSDPNLIASEDKFLLSENRATVALSRVKDQLVVIVAESVIEHIPTDTELYNEASLWKRLAEYAGYTDESAAADWDGSLEQFTSNIPDTSVEGEEVSIVVYSSC
jgi:uncharacterized protein